MLSVDRPDQFSIHHPVDPRCYQFCKLFHVSVTKVGIQEATLNLSLPVEYGGGALDLNDIFHGL